MRVSECWFSGMTQINFDLKTGLLSNQINVSVPGLKWNLTVGVIFYIIFSILRWLQVEKYMSKSLKNQSRKTRSTQNRFSGKRGKTSVVNLLPLNGGYKDFKEFFENRKYFQSKYRTQKLGKCTNHAISHRLMSRKFIFLWNPVFDHSWPPCGYEWLPMNAR